MSLKDILLILLLTAGIAGCRDPYEPPAITAPNRYLVVEGFINSDGPVSFRLTRTRSVSDAAQTISEANATVSIEDKQHNSYPLHGEGGGFYTTNWFKPDSLKKYRLHILTSDGKEYVSDFVPVVHPPEIDSVSWQLENSGVQLYVNTHDPAGNTRYYRWEYEETWEFHSIYTSYYMYVEPDVVYRTDQVHVCWQADRSTAILLGSSAKLSSDVIYEAPLTFISHGDEKMSVLYSILVKQYGLTREGFEYWQRIKKNSEQLGSIFDPQPSYAPGNIHCVSDSGERVIGYVSAGSVTEQRIFVRNDALPPDWNSYEFCALIVVPTDSFDYYYKGGYMPVTPEYGSGGLIGYQSAYRHCVDCTLRGTNVKPGFWP